jgi:hypothetical protein
MKMNFDFSHLYNQEVVHVQNAKGEPVFTAVVREITHGEKSGVQTVMMADMEIPTEGSKATRQRLIKEQMKKAMKNGVSAKISVYEELAAIESWTLKDVKGNEVPVCQEAWNALPYFLSKQIVDAIERLNPEIDEDFQD